MLKLVENLTVVAGDHTQSKDEGTEQTIQVKDYFEHPGWFKNKKNPSDNDFAILKLAKPVLFTKYVNPICLPPKNKNFDSVEAKASGWGRFTGAINETFGYKSDILQKVQIIEVETIVKNLFHLFRLF